MTTASPKVKEAHRGKLTSFLVFGSILVLLELLAGFRARFTPSAQSHFLPPSQHSRQPSYEPSSVERYIINNGMALGYSATYRGGMKPTCTLWTDSNLPFHGNLSQYREELANYTRRVEEFEPVQDLRLSLQNNDHHICDTLELDPHGLAGVFPSRQLSAGSFGWIEPMLPPLRHPNFCVHGGDHLMNMNYMVHDFAAMCRNLKPTSRTILVDIGASLDFHERRGGVQPAIYLTNLYHKFGFPFDHIYAFEVTPKPPDEVYKKVPENLLASYHWINVGVESDPQSRLNPLKMLLDNYNRDDFIVVKLDIDTPSIEIPLAMQLLEDARYSNLIDQFYFEHHVFLKELARAWKKTMRGSLLDSIKFFMGLREKGIAAHSWV